MSIDSKLKKLMLGAAVAVVLIIIVFGYLLFAPLKGGGQQVYVYVDNDDTADSVYAKISEAVPSASGAGLHLGGALCGVGSGVHPGCYEAGSDIGALRLMHNIAKGRQVPVKVTIPLARTVEDLAGRLSHVLMADSVELQKAILDKAHDDQLKMALCLFIPNTYEVYWNISAEDFVERMEREYNAFWTKERKSAAAAVELTPDEVYTLAGIVEQETANDAERPKVAGMYLNRLKVGMKLQADPTVKYALYAAGDRSAFSIRRITQEMCKVDNAYNTYRYEGLPVGPICIPSLASIEAVLHPAKHDYMYMCAKEDFSGTHNFAVTYAEHLVNAKRYAKALDEKGI